MLRLRYGGGAYDARRGGVTAMLLVVAARAQWCGEAIGVLSAFENKTAAALRAQFIAQRARRKRCAEAGKASVSMN